MLMLDDWGLEPSIPRPVTITSKYSKNTMADEPQSSPASPRRQWRELIGDPTYADAILDRIVHNAHRINLSGNNLRRPRPNSAPRIDRLTDQMPKMTYQRDINTPATSSESASQEAGGAGHPSRVDLSLNSRIGVIGQDQTF